MTRSSIAVAILTLVLTGTSRPARAQIFTTSPAGPGQLGNIEGFTVTGIGSASARPNRFEIELEVSASSELSADAIVKYRDAKRRLQEAFRALKLDNVAVEERGLLVDEKGNQVSPYYFDAQTNRRAKAEVQLTRKLVVTCGKIGKMDEEALLQLIAKLLDVAQDAGGKVGGQNNFNPYYYYDGGNRNQTGLVRFILDDFDKLEEEAYGKAFADAEARAQRLAKLSHVKLGAVSAVRETLAPSLKPTGQHDDEPPRKRLESTRFQEIPVKVELAVRFNVAGPLENGRSTAP